MQTEWEKFEQHLFNVKRALAAHSIVSGTDIQFNIPFIISIYRLLLFLDLEIELNKNQIYYKDFIDSFNLKEKVNFFFNEEDSLNNLPKLKANIINTKSNKVFSIN